METEDTESHPLYPSQPKQTGIDPSHTTIAVHDPLPAPSYGSIKPLRGSGRLRSISAASTEWVRKVHSRQNCRCCVSDHGGEATIAESIFNLMKNIVGSSMLALPGGIAAFGDAPTAVIPAIVLILIMACVNAYYFSLIGRICCLTGAKTYREAWEKSVGTRKLWMRVGAGLVAFCTSMKCALGNLAGSMILADSFHSLFLTVGLAPAFWTRSRVLLVITVVVLWPLCLIGKYLKVLAPFSLLGIVGVLLTVLAIALRYVDGSYNRETFLEDLSPTLSPYFGTVGARGFWANPGKSLMFVGMLATAYVAHYNAPRFFVELKGANVPRFNRIVTVSYLLGALIYVTVAVTGFFTFGGHSQGFILNNYSTRDGIATTCRIAISVSIMLSYPLIFVGFRDGILDLAKVPNDKQTVGHLNMLSTGLLMVITALALKFRDLDLVLSFGGATLAPMVIYVFPSIMFYSCVVKLGKECVSDQAKLESSFALCLMFVGIMLGVLCVLMSLDVVQ